MYYITKKDSETGKKFQAVLKLKDIAEKAQRALLDKYGVTEFRQPWISVFGGISTCVFKQKPEGWRLDSRQNRINEYVPDLRTKAGKNIQAEIDSLPFVSIEELNRVVGFQSFLSHIGCRMNNDIFFGFSVFEKWEIKMPIDCEEVTSKRYRELFPPEE